MLMHSTKRQSWVDQTLVQCNIYECFDEKIERWLLVSWWGNVVNFVWRLLYLQNHFTGCIEHNVSTLSLRHLNCNNRFIELCLWNQLMSRKSKSICNISKSREHRNHFGLISWIKFLLQLDLIDEIKSNIQTDWIDDYIFPTQIPTNGLKRCTKNGIARTK